MTHHPNINAGPHELHELPTILRELDDAALRSEWVGLIADSVLTYGVPQAGQLIAALNVVAARMRNAPVPPVARPADAVAHERCRHWSLRAAMLALESGRLLEKSPDISITTFHGVAFRVRNAQRPIVVRTLTDGRVVAYLNDGAVQVETVRGGKKTP